MTPAKLNVYIAMFAYSGNGSIPSVSAITAKWLAHLMPKLIQDDRVGKVVLKDICDTPITMTRNWAVHEARQAQCDVLLMLDSDMHPDMYVGAPPFWDLSFDFLYDRLISKNHPTVIGAPYCGPPCNAQGQGEANPYVFRWYQREEGTENLELRFLNRNEAAMMTGIQPMAALPTGLILYSMNAFELMEPPYFRYEMSDKYCHTKMSTEDVYNTREIGLAAASMGLGDVLFANMDSWAGHMKVKTMGKPFYVDSRYVSKTFHKNYLDNGEATGGHEAWTLPEQDTGAVEIKSITDEYGNEWFEEEPTIKTEAGADGEPVHRVNVVKRMICGNVVETYGNQTPQGDLSALNGLVRSIVKKLDVPFRGVEIGSWCGESAVAMASALAERDGGGTITCVDHFQGSQGDLTGKIADQVNPKPFFMKNTEKFRSAGILGLVEKESTQLAKSLKKPHNLHLVYIDGEHTKDAVLADLQAWYPHVADDGIIAGHDLTDAFPGVKEALTEFFPPSVEIFNPEGTMVWWVRKSDVLKARQHDSQLRREVGGDEGESFPNAGLGQNEVDAEGVAS